MRSACDVLGQPMQLFYAKILDFASLTACQYDCMREVFGDVLVVDSCLNTRSNGCVDLMDPPLAVTFPEAIEIVLISVTSYATDQLIAKLLADHADHALVVASCASSDSR